MIDRPALPSSRSGGKAWLRTVVVAALGIALAVVAFFFIAIALALSACLAVVIAVRWWWMMRRLRAAARAAGPLEGEYAVVDESRREQRRR